MEELKIIYLPPEALKPYERNARKHAEKDLATIRASVEQFGFLDPIGIWGGDNLIVEGHGRQLVALEKGMKEVPCIRLDQLTDEQRRAYALAHNKTAEMSEWDFAALEAELNNIDCIDMSQFGFEDIFPETEEPEIIEDEPPEPPEEPKSKPGDIYQLGEHRLICGDCTDPAIIDALTDGAEMDLLLTDPPYNVAIAHKIDPNQTKTTSRS